MLDPVLDPIPKHVNAIHEQNEFVHLIVNPIACTIKRMQTLNSCNLCTDAYTCLIALDCGHVLTYPTALIAYHTRESPFTQTRIGRRRTPHSSEHNEIPLVGGTRPV